MVERRGRCRVLPDADANAPTGVRLIRLTFRISTCLAFAVPLHVFSGGAVRLAGAVCQRTMTPRAGEQCCRIVGLLICMSCWRGGPSVGNGYPRSHYYGMPVHTGRRAAADDRNVGVMVRPLAVISPNS